MPLSHSVFHTVGGKINLNLAGSSQKRITSFFVVEDEVSKTRYGLDFVIIYEYIFMYMLK